MDKENLNKKNLIKNFEKINEMLFDLDYDMRFVITGGSAFILKDLVSRVTVDIDLINKVDEKVLAIITSSLAIDINDKVSVKSFRKIFLGWEKEVEIFKKYSNLTVEVLSNEMLVATKFFTKESDRDISEMAQRGIYVNKNKVEEIVKEIIERSSSLELSWMKKREMEIMEFYKASGWDWNDSDIKKLLQ